MRMILLLSLGVVLASTTTGLASLEEPLLDVQLFGDAKGTIAISLTGNSTGSIAASGTGNATRGITVSGMGNSSGWGPSASGTGDAHGCQGSSNIGWCATVSAGGNATSRFGDAALSGLGTARCDPAYPGWYCAAVGGRGADGSVAASPLGDATGVAAVSVFGDAHGVVAVTVFGNATGTYQWSVFGSCWTQEGWPPEYEPCELPLP